MKPKEPVGKRDINPKKEVRERERKGVCVEEIKAVKGKAKKRYIESQHAARKRRTCRYMEKKDSEKMAKKRQNPV